MSSSSPANPDQLLDLYHRAFPVGERRSDEDILTSLRSKHYLTFRTFDGNTLIGFALVFAPQDETFALLEYLAVDLQHRGSGVGSRLFCEMNATVADRYLLVEVESVLLGPDAVRRQRFYERFGCHRLPDFHYHLPIPNSPPMQLMIRPAADIAHLMERWLKRIYRDVYGCSGDDSRLLQMISDLRRSPIRFPA